MNVGNFLSELPSNGLVSGVLLAGLGALVGWVVHHFASPQRRRSQRLMMGLVYGILWGVALSVLALLGLDASAGTTQKLSPLHFVELVGLAGLIAGSAALLSATVSAWYARRFQKPMSRPMVDFESMRAARANRQSQPPSMDTVRPRRPTAPELV